MARGSSCSQKDVPEAATFGVICSLLFAGNALQDGERFGATRHAGKSSSKHLFGFGVWL